MAAIVTNLAVSVHSKKGSKPKLITPLELMPDWSGEFKEVTEKQQSIEEMKEVLLQIAKMSKKRAERAKQPPMQLQLRNKKKEK